jgi:hypothetical protein
VADPLGVARRGGIWLGFTLYDWSTFEGKPFDYGCEPAADWDYAIRAAKRGGIWLVAGRHESYRDRRHTASRRGLRDAAALAITVLQKLSFEDPTAEALRRRLSLDAAKRHAFGLAASDRTRESQRLYRALGGPRSNAHYVLTELMIRLPRPMAQALQRSVWALSGSIARMREAVPL